ncbi:hypothetical protein HMPREF1624_07908 [Sporothrix schenckii ATCC 58251]|uniref:Probable transporter MCH1 n=1 Tax=Sporothrix schenckii (strain ATCC 58251 / de Perez 2211183) TaxID=1391915 RepID=U7PLK7_SPOS1|nr:hypothetical protein HMPREF1624_07908 [Sporothrix schenckii ATCC 58251]
MSETPPLSSSSSFSSIRSLSPDLSSSRIYRRRRRNNAASAVSRQTALTVAFVSAIVSALCAGSVTVFSLYGHIFQERLHYSQFQVNGVAIAASISCYLPVPLMGYVCDRVGPAPLSLLSSVLFGGGYGLAAILYKKAATEATVGAGGAPAPPTTRAYALMVAAFVCIGAATCAMYLSAVATCAKNFGRGRHRGLALAAPIAAFGLSGMWQSQLGSRLLYERLPPLPDDGPGAPPRRGDVNVSAFFLFLAILLSVVGLLGTFTLRVVDEAKLIDEAVDELERSGLLDGSALFPSSIPGHVSSSAAGIDDATVGRPTRFGPGVSRGNSSIGIATNGRGTANGSYGTMGRTNPFCTAPSDDEDDETTVDETSRMLRGRGRCSERVRGTGDDGEDDALASRRLLDPGKDNRDDGDGDGDDEDSDEAGRIEAQQARFKKAWVLNAETHRFLSDHTMWLFALGFFFMIGPGEAFINNLGTVIKTLYPPSTNFAAGGGTTTAATHVSIVGITSTVARLLTGSLTDLLAPRPQTQHLQAGTASSVPSVDAEDAGAFRRVLSRVSVSRIAFLLTFALLLSAGLVVLASGAAQNHGDRFWIVSGLVGAGYGAVFSLTPIIITVIWGVENFGTNWGIVAMFPALGATFWGLVYSAVYQAGVTATNAPNDPPSAAAEDSLCYGTQCYAPTFWAMAGSVWLACLLVLLAWKGRNGWSQRGIVI